MAADVFVNFLERKLAEHWVQKVVPADPILQTHARRVIEQQFAERERFELSERIKAAAAEVVIPDNIKHQVEEVLKRRPDLSWDIAVEHILGTVA
jgi:hypothetical protein